MAEERARGLTPLPIHLMLVDDNATPERGRTACDGGLGGWITGDVDQVTCHPCVEQMHA